MISKVAVWLVTFGGIAGLLYFLVHKRVGLYAKFFWVMLLFFFIVPYSDILEQLPTQTYYLPAVSIPVLTFFLFLRKKWSVAIFLTVNLSAVLIIGYAFTLALYFLNHYMGPPFPNGESPSLVISGLWVYGFLWFVLPLDAIYMFIYLAKMRQK